MWKETLQDMEVSRFVHLVNQLQADVGVEFSVGAQDPLGTGGILCR